MMKRFLILIFVVVLFGCSTRNETKFSEKALNDIVFSLNGDQLAIQEVLEKYKGKKIFIDVWATWCGDCLKSLPTVKKLQILHPGVVFLFLSIDDSISDLKAGIQKYNIEGEHYLLPEKWDADFSEFLGLSWIPRYLIVDESGGIKVFNETKPNSSDILEALK